MNRIKNVNLSDIKLPWPRFDLKVDGITQGLIMSYLKCRVEFLLRLNKWGLLEEKTTFANGAITHDTLDKVYTFYQWHSKLPLLLTIRKWIYEYDIKNPGWLPKATNDEKLKIKAVCFVMVTEYIKFYHTDFERFEILGAEDIFDLRWNGYRIRGKKDLRYRFNDEKWIMETKTMGRIDENDLVDKIAFDFQSGFYVFAEEVEDPEPVKGVVYNVVRNPGHKVGETETLDQFCGRLRRAIRKDPEHFFYRWRIPYTRIDKVRFRKDLLAILLEIEMFLDGELKTYPNSKNCVTRFRCSFLRACASRVMVGYINTYPIFKELGETE